jgi:signal transduction histidine kinase
MTDPSGQGEDPSVPLRRLAGGLAHDLTNYVSGVMGYADIFLDWLQDQGRGSEMQPRLELLQAASRQMDDRVRSLRLLAGSYRSRHEVLDIPALAALIAATLPPVAVGAAVTGSGRVRADRVLMADAIRAAASLAVAPPAWSIVIADGGLEIRLDLPGDDLPAPDLACWWEPYRLRQAGGRGEGLGIAALPAIMALHAGRVALTPAPGGLRCTLSLPLADGPIASPAG